MNSILHDSQNLSFDGDSKNHATAALKISSSLINDEGAVMFSSFGQASTLKNTNKVITPQQHENIPLASHDGGFDGDFGAGNNWDDGDDGADDYGPQNYGDISVHGPSQGPSPSVKSLPSLQLASWGSLPNFPALTTTKPEAVPSPANNPLALYDPHDPTEAKNSKPVKKDKRTYRIPTTKQNQLKVNTGTSGLTRRQLMLKSLQSSESSSPSTGNSSSSCQLMSSLDLLSMITRCSISSSSKSNKYHNMSLTGSTAPVSRSLAALQQKKKSVECTSNPLLKLDENSTYQKPILKQEDHTNIADDGYYGGDGGEYDNGDDDEDYGPNGFDNNDHDPHELPPQYDGEMNNALYHLHEEKLLAQRVENALNDAGLNTSIGNYSVISGCDSRHSIDSTTSLLTTTSGNKDTFEILCKKYIQNFIIGTEKYNRETNLNKRVTEWTNKIEPLLKEQEERVVFDIHNYSDTTLNTIHNLSIEHMKTTSLPPSTSSTSSSSSSSSTIHFSEIVRGKPSYEVSRVFLACLQLANLGNIDFQQHDLQDFDVNLLNEKSQRLNIENYRAPSAAAGGASGGVLHGAAIATATTAGI